MMGLGYLGSGGSSSSSSNLSALAPPFTVDRSNPKPNSNPLVHFTEPPPPYTPFSSSLHNWQYPHSPAASRPDFFSNRDSEIDSIQTASLPSANDYPPYVNPPSTPWPPLNPSAKNATNTFSYLGEPKPYYPPYVSPVVTNDTPLVALNEPSYDLLSTSSLVPMDGSPQGDYIQSLSGLEYNPQWGGFWNGLAEGKRGKRMDGDRSFCSEETNVAGLVLYKNYMKQGACITESLSKCKEDSAISYGKYADVFGRESCAGSLSTGQMDDKSFLVQNVGLIGLKTSKVPVLGTGSVLTESHLQAPAPESATNIWNHQNPYSPYEKSFQLFDSCLNDGISVTKSSPALVIRAPAVGSTSSARDTVSSKTVDVGNIAAVNSTDVASYKPSKEKKPHRLLSSEFKGGYLDTNQSNFHIGRNDHHIFAASASTEQEPSNSKWRTKNALDHAFKTRSGFQVPDINVPDSFSLAVDSTEAVKTTTNSSESLDSPCWKGAPASHFSPFEVSEAPQHLMKKLEPCSGLNLQGSLFFPPYNDSVKVSSRELCENTAPNKNVCADNGLSPSSKRPSDANFPAKEHKSDDAVKAGADCTKLSSSKEVQFSNDINKPRKECDLPNESNNCSDSKPSHTKQMNLQEDNLTSKHRLELGAGVVDAGMNANDASEDNYVPLHVGENVSCLPSSGEYAPKPVKPHGKESTPKMNVQMLVNAMHNLSELLLFHCTNDACALKEQDHEALEHVIVNLDACMLKKIVHATPIQESRFPQQGTSHILRKGTSAGIPQVTNEAAVNSHGLLDCQYLHEEKRNYDITAKKTEKISDLVTLKDDADVLKDHDMVQAIKKVLDENFQCVEELQSQTPLYKNLWLEAEAELCSISYRARFDRMKIKMEKCKLDKAKDASENTTTAAKISSSNVSPDPNTIHTLTTEANDSSIPSTSVQDSPISSSTSLVDDVEASIMARFHILKCRGDNSNPINREEQQLSEVVDAVFTGKKDHRPFVGDQSEHESFDGSMGPHLQHHTGNDIEVKLDSHTDNPEDETVKDFRVCVTDDPVIQSWRNNRLWTQLPSGWYDNSSSDWEHVLKDDFLWRN